MRGALLFLRAHRVHVGLACVALAVVHGLFGVLALASGDDRDVVFNGKLVALLLLGALAWNPPRLNRGEGGAR